LVIGAGCTRQAPEAAGEGGAGHGAAWSYEGADGPDHWAASYPDCGGASQSPVDVRGATRDALPALQFAYGPVEGRAHDTGHALQVDVSPGPTLQIGADAYALVQFHVHTPSEHTFDGRTYDGVVHLVHRDSAGGLAVVAVLVQRGVAQPFLDTLQIAWSAATRTATTLTVDITALLPETLAYFTYAGSLTTPPCTEGVRWVILQTPVQASPAQLQVLEGRHSDNVRPVQPLNGRLIRAGGT
jgi:carbonic anhydrase